MEENLQNNDHLESFFKKSFEQDHAPNPTGEWDNPADSLWDKIAEELPEEPNKKVIYLPRLLVGVAVVLLFLLGGGSLFLYFQNKDLTRIIKRQNQIVKEISKEKPTPPPPSSTATSQNKVSRTNDSSPRKESISIASTTKQNSSPKTTTPIYLPPQKDTIVRTGNPPHIAMTAINIDAKVIAPIPGIKAGLNTEAPPVNLYLQYAPPIAFNADKQSGFFLGLYVAPSYSGKKITPNTPDSPLPFKGKEMAKTAANWGIKIGLDLNKKWAILSGVSHSSIVQVQRRRIVFNHEPGNEHQENNEYVSSYSLSLPSSLGESDATVDIARPDNHPLNNRMLPIDVTLKQRLSFVSIPLLVKYNRQFGRLRLSATGGFAFNILSKFQSKIQVQTLRQNFRTRRLRTIQSPALDNKTSIDFVGGIGVSYGINQHFSLFIEPQLQKNIRPFIKNNSFRSSLYITGVQIGGYWSF